MHSIRDGIGRIKVSRIAGYTVVATVVFAVGCHSKVVDKAEFKSALNNYLSSRQSCLWPEAVKFPAQADTKNEDQTKGYDALTDAGLLLRTPAEKKRFLIGSKPVNNYDLSDKGRSHWTTDPAQPGYGNFCFGHPQVSSIDQITPDTGGATQYTVNFHYGLTPPEWINTAEVQTAFPSLATQSSGKAATATLTKANDGWQVQVVSPANGVPQPQ